VKVKFYVGAVESNFWDGQEAHILTRLDYVLTAHSDEATDQLDIMLRTAGKEFIRSDSHYMAAIEISVLNRIEVQP
jgi:hypothetical protein